MGATLDEPVQELQAQKRIAVAGVSRRESAHTRRPT
jgi:hypothetical protein